MQYALLATTCRELLRELPEENKKIQKAVLENFLVKFLARAELDNPNQNFQWQQKFMRMAGFVIN